MACGPCTDFLIAGDIKIRCTCQHGVFNIQSNTFHDNERCKTCTHPLSMHADIDSSDLFPQSATTATDTTASMPRSQPLTDNPQSVQLQPAAKKFSGLPNRPLVASR